MKLTTPGAILFGLLGTGAMVGVAVYVALARRVPPSTTSAEPALPSAPPSADRAAVQSEARRALEARRADLVNRCWTPSVAKSPLPEHVDYVLNVTFDAAGKQITRGLVEGDGKPAAPRIGPDGRLVPGHPSRADVTSCLGTALGTMSVTPPGATVYVEVPFGLP
jgi:hypothetical protein